MDSNLVDRAHFDDDIPTFPFDPSDAIIGAMSSPPLIVHSSWLSARGSNTILRPYGGEPAPRQIAEVL
jgi:hypothetical protein